MLVQELTAKAAIEGPYERIIRWFAQAGKVRDHAALESPQVYVARYDLAALIEADGLGLAGDATYPVECRHHILSAVAVAEVEHGHVARESVDDGQNPQLSARRVLIMHEVHRPNIVRTDGYSTVIGQLRLHPPFKCLVPQLNPQLPVNPIDFLDVDAPAFAIQQDMDTPVALAHLPVKGSAKASRPPTAIPVLGVAKV